NWLVNEDKNEIKYYVEAIVEEGIAESKEFKFKGKKLIDAPQKTVMLCHECGSILRPLDKLSEDECGMVEMQDWFSSVCRNGLNGPSPSGAAEELGCHRTMVDRLVELGVLEKSKFEFKGQKVVIISRRSIDIAKQNRERTGNWTGYPVRKGA
ncbi:MAG: hypothetical protein PHI84_19895, partial [Kiritimatiellae bacterium]|nr:hypothetical protein [Kiritimatiellia bacterium]